MTPPWPCHKCGEPGARNIGTQGWCDVHLGELFARMAADLEHRHADRVRALLLPPSVPDDITDTELADVLRRWADDLWGAVVAGDITRDEAEHLMRAATAA